MAPSEQPTFSFDTVAVLISAILANGQTIGMSHYEAMSALDGSRTANAFSHQFRSVVRRARELNDLQKSGNLKPATGKPRGKSETKKGTARPVKGKKRGAADDRIEDGDDESEAGSPAKKVKSEMVDEDAAED